MIHSNEIAQHTKGLSILFVEDHEELRLDTVEILKSFFKSVDSCENGQIALDKYKDFKVNSGSYYDIVLSDIQMPIMNGIELTEKIYEINSKQSIIILSAYDDSKYLLSLINLGIEQFIKKPIDYQELLGTFLNVAKKIERKNTVVKTGAFLELGENTLYDKNAKSLSVNGKNVYLTKYEIIFIELLTTQFGKIYSNENIVTRFNDLEESMDATNIRKLVSKLRKKLSENSVESIYGIGYKFLPYYKS